jgi:glutathione synthase
MRLVYVMDPVDRVLWDKDTTFAIQRAAASLGHSALHCLPRDLYVENGDVFARVRELTVSDTEPHFRFGEPEDVRLADVEAVLIRKDPPFDVAYLYMTLMLERARGRTVIMNDPRGLRDANEKLYALHFARHMPQSIVTSSSDRILSFVTSMGGKGVIKPLYGAGGSGVMMLTIGDKNIRAIIELQTREGTEEVMVQEYLPSVEKGDKRVLLLDGEILGGINRVPRSDDLRSNIHVGGRVEPIEVSAEERAVVTDIAPRLRADGLYFVGLDFIGNKLTEVNVTSPTGIQELSRHRGEDMALKVIAWIETRTGELRPQLHSIPT